MAPDVSPFVLLFASIFTSNILLTNFLGMCSFIALSRDIKSSAGLGLAVTVVLTITSALNWLVLHGLLIPLEITYLRFIVFIIVIATTVQILEMIIDRFSPTLYIALGIFLPLITVNCAILGVALFIEIRSYTFVQSTLFGLGSGLGWWLAIMALASIQKRIANNPRVPASLKGSGLTFIIIGLMAMAFLGFSGMISVS